METSDRIRGRDNMVWALRRAIIALHDSDSYSCRCIARECVMALQVAGERLPSAVDISTLMAPEA